MKVPYIFKTKLLLLIALQAVCVTAAAQSVGKSLNFGDVNGLVGSSTSSELKSLCLAHLQRLSDWNQGGEPGRVISPTSALVVFPDDSPKRYDGDIKRMCAGVFEPDSAALSQLEYERGSARDKDNSKHNLGSVEVLNQPWANLPRRQASVEKDVFDDVISQQNSTGKKAREQLTQKIPELAPSAIAAQSVDIVGILSVLGQVVLDQSAVENPDAALAAKEILSEVGLGEFTASDQAIAKGREAKRAVNDAVINAQRSPNSADQIASTRSSEKDDSSGKEVVTLLNYQNWANTNCVELRGSSLANKCNQPLLIAFCVTNPQQTKNFFDGSDGMSCSTGGGLDTISAGKSHGLVLYGVIQYFACPYTDYYTPARMKTKLSPQGYYIGTCGDDVDTTGGKVSWTVGNAVVSQPRR